MADPIYRLAHPFLSYAILQQLAVTIKPFDNDTYQKLSSLQKTITELTHQLILKTKDYCKNKWNIDITFTDSETTTNNISTITESNAFIDEEQNQLVRQHIINYVEELTNPGKLAIMLDQCELAMGMQLKNSSTYLKSQSVVNYRALCQQLNVNEDFNKRVVTYLIIEGNENLAVEFDQMYVSKQDINHAVRRERLFEILMSSNNNVGNLITKKAVIVACIEQFDLDCLRRLCSDWLELFASMTRFENETQIKNEISVEEKLYSNIKEFLTVLPTTMKAKEETGNFSLDIDCATSIISDEDLIDVLRNVDVFIKNLQSKDSEYYSQFENEQEVALIRHMVLLYQHLKEFITCQLNFQAQVNEGMHCYLPILLKFLISPEKNNFKAENGERSIFTILQYIKNTLPLITLSDVREFRNLNNIVRFLHQQMTSEKYDKHLHALSIYSLSYKHVLEKYQLMPVIKELSTESDAAVSNITATLKNVIDEANQVFLSPCMQRLTKIPLLMQTIIRALDELLALKVEITVLSNELKSARQHLSDLTLLVQQRVNAANIGYMGANDILEKLENIGRQYVPISKNKNGFFSQSVILNTALNQHVYNMLLTTIENIRKPLVSNTQFESNSDIFYQKIQQEFTQLIFDVQKFNGSGQSQRVLVTGYQIAEQLKQVLIQHLPRACIPDDWQTENQQLAFKS